MSNVASCKRRSASSLYLHIVSTPPCKIADIPNTYTVCAFEEQNKHSIQNHMNALATCAASAWYLTLNMPVIFIATFIEPLAGCPWQGRFITPQRRSYRAPQGSPSYVGGHRSEVSLYLRCSPPECAVSIQAYRLQIALIGAADGLGGKRKIALAQ